MQVHYIYGLYDSSDERSHPTWKRAKGHWIRYVGAGFDPDIRLRSHINDSRKKNLTRKHRWIRSVLKRGRVPAVTVLEICTLADWKRHETRWIASFPKGQLTNSTAGGDGLVNPSKDIRDRISKKVTMLMTGNQHRKGIGWITNGRANRAWPKDELILPKGFRWGYLVGLPQIRNIDKRLPRQITNGAETRMLAPNAPLPEGWFYGRKGKSKPLSKEHKLAIGKSNTGKKRPWAKVTAKLAHAVVRGSHWINNGVEQKFSKEEIVPDGWALGRLLNPRKGIKLKPPKPPRPPGPTEAQIAFHEWMKTIMADRVWVTNGIERKRVPGDAIPEGWYPLKGIRKWATNGTNNVLLFPDQPLPDGWRYGMTKPLKGELI